MHQYTQLIVLLLAILAPAASWIAGKMREQYELKKARDNARRNREESLRTTQLAERAAPGQPATPEAKRERERQDLAARRQAQLRELRQRQYERGSRPGNVVVRGPGATPPAPSQPPQRPVPTLTRPTGPLRPGVPAQRTNRPTMPTARPTPPVARPIPAPQPRRPVAPPPPPARPLVEPRPAAPTQREVAATEIGRGQGVRARTSGIGGEVRGMLMGPDGRPLPRADLARVFALTEVLSPPIAMRPNDQLPWERV